MFLATNDDLSNSLGGKAKKKSGGLGKGILMDLGWFFGLGSAVSEHHQFKGFKQRLKVEDFEGFDDKTWRPVLSFLAAASPTSEIEQKQNDAKRVLKPM